MFGTLELSLTTSLIEKWGPEMHVLWLLLAPLVFAGRRGTKRMSLCAPMEEFQGMVATTQEI